MHTYLHTKITQMHCHPQWGHLLFYDTEHIILLSFKDKNVNIVSSYTDSAISACTHLATLHA